MLSLCASAMAQPRKPLARLGAVNLLRSLKYRSCLYAMCWRFSRLAGEPKMDLQFGVVGLVRPIPPTSVWSCRFAEPETVSKG